MYLFENHLQTCQHFFISLVWKPMSCSCTLYGDDIFKVSIESLEKCGEKFGAQACNILCAQTYTNRPTDWPQ